MLLNDQVNGHIYDFLADLLFFQHIQVNRLDFNAWKCWQTCHYIEHSEYKLYMGHIQTLVLTRKRFSEKPIVAFTNSTLLNFILDFYIYD